MLFENKVQRIFGHEIVMRWKKGRNYVKLQDVLRDEVNIMMGSVSHCSGRGLLAEQNPYTVL
jgi:hypothetical protein